MGDGLLDDVPLEVAKGIIEAKDTEIAELKANYNDRYRELIAVADESVGRGKELTEARRIIGELHSKTGHANECGIFHDPNKCNCIRQEAKAFLEGD